MDHIHAQLRHFLITSHHLLPSALLSFSVSVSYSLIFRCLFSFLLYRTLPWILFHPFWARLIINFHPSQLSWLDGVWRGASAKSPWQNWFSRRPGCAGCFRVFVLVNMNTLRCLISAPVYIFFDFFQPPALIRTLINFSLIS